MTEKNEDHQLREIYLKSQDLALERWNHTGNSIKTTAIQFKRSSMLFSWNTMTWCFTFLSIQFLNSSIVHSHIRRHRFRRQSFSFFPFLVIPLTRGSFRTLCVQSADFLTPTLLEARKGQRLVLISQRFSLWLRFDSDENKQYLSDIILSQKWSFSTGKHMIWQWPLWHFQSTAQGLACCLGSWPTAVAHTYCSMHMGIYRNFPYISFTFETAIEFVWDNTGETLNHLAKWASLCSLLIFIPLSLFVFPSAKKCRF